jgi:hypothetical protein
MMRKTLLLAFSMLLMSPLALGSAAVASDLDVCPTCTYTTIQSAIDAAGYGDTIRVAQGTYDENLDILSSKTVAISGGWSADFSTQVSPFRMVTIAGEDASGPNPEMVRLTSALKMWLFRTVIAHRATEVGSASFREATY